MSERPAGRPSHDTPPELQTIVDDLAGAIGRAAVINDTDLKVLAASAQGEPIDRARVESILSRRTPEPVKDYAFSLGIFDTEVPVVVPEHPGLGILRRLCVPLRHGAERYGFLWIILGAHDVGDADRQVIRDSAERASEAFHAQRTAAAAGRAERASMLLEAILSAGPEDISQLVDEFSDVVPIEADQQFVLHVYRDAVGTRADHAGSQADGRGQRIPSRRPGVIVVEGASETVALTRSAASLRAPEPSPITGGDYDGHGVSKPFNDIRDVRQARDEARFAALVAAVVPEFAGSAGYADLGGWLLFERLPWTRDCVRSISTAAAELIVPGREMLLETVSTYLSNAGDASATIADLRVHRTTFYYRMDKVRQVIGDVLEDGWSSSALHAALKLYQLVLAVEARGSDR
ncbi:PucR family transcriptional regulator [Gordonia rhizosphera]|uniref:Putative CdaR family transcriptional regulator n=1 Tax=Gordonia rhizosphera NBRC 16068 TaxID=1108045 RepID=K6WZ42_9ACTN|nr:helix-turn-helix domain-containing protein [Gordonia rhizosphera]GAB91794.1 putative CdaR family transcriptional regulator [Gordonia rhizosphera NBRC 16068]